MIHPIVKFSGEICLILIGFGFRLRTVTAARGEPAVNGVKDHSIPLSRNYRTSYDDPQITLFILASLCGVSHDIPRRALQNEGIASRENNARR
jgi:hypothetical protein